MDAASQLVEFEALVARTLPDLAGERIGVSGTLYRNVMARVERPLLRHALDLSGGNQLRAARLLGINRNTLRKRLRLFGLLPASSRGRRVPTTGRGPGEPAAGFASLPGGRGS